MSQQVAFAQYRELLYTYFWPQRRQVLVLVVLILLDNGLQLLGPRLLGQFVDSAIHATESSQLQRIGIYYLVVMICRQVARLFATYMGETIGWRASNALRFDLAQHTMALDMSYHKQQNPGIMIERIDGDVTSLNRFFSQMVLQIGGSILLLISTVGVLLAQNWQLGVMMFLFIIVAAIILYLLRNVAVPYWEGGREASAQLFGFLEERLAGMEDIRGLGSRGHTMTRFEQLMLRKNHYDILGRVYGGVTWIVPVGLAAILSILILGIGTHLYLTNQIGIGLIVMTLLYGEMVVWPIRTIAQEIDQLQQATAGIVRVAEIMAIKSRLVDGTQEMPAQAPAIAFDRITFAYPDEEVDKHPVLRDVSFVIPPQKVVGLLGRTGSGKSTLIRLLFRLYDVNAGEIRFDQAPIRDFTLASLRQHVGLVTQDVQLFYATVRDNLTFFNKDISDDRLYEALRTLGLQRWLEQQPDGLDTLLMANGAVSAGEAQLIALARVYLKQPHVVILDEASARIDPETEKLVERALDTVLAGKTAIIIAHRLQTVRRCDYIAILGDGQLIEYGAEHDLRANEQSRYATLLRTGSVEEELA
ncbi:MAG: ABC transporter ATP-binding protein [Roseiflexaceae bacterium]|jgi:ATP-binding cassette subfamily B protein|nr:ABC transporter ATP-binding protein/permease [Chloroflexaceae bacterium]